MAKKKKKKAAPRKKKTPAAAKKKIRPAAAAKKKTAKKKVAKAKPKPVAKKKVATPARKRPAPRVAQVAPLRRDLYVYNEATGFVITSAGMAGRVQSSRPAKWNDAVAEGRILPVELVQDDSLLLRVVVGAPLEPEEEAGWVGRLVSRLSIPDGRLVVTGGCEFLEEPELDEETRGTYTRELAVAPGEYRATLLATIHGVNGPFLLERAGAEEPLGAWCRRTRPGERFPVWLYGLCRSDPRHDPGHWDEWSGAPEEDARPAGLLDFVLHLEPLAAGQAAPPTPPLDHGFVSLAAFEARRPQRCPRDLLARDPLGREDEASREDEAPLRTVDVRAQVADHQPLPLEGGPVEHPVRDLVDVYTIAWLAADGPDPELLIELPAGSTWTPGWPRLEGLAVEAEPGRVRVGFAPSGGRWEQMRAVDRIAPHLSTLPEGSVLELLSAPSRFGEEEENEAERDPRIGVHRYRGPVEHGRWRIAEAFPALGAAVLREALALVEEIQAGTRLACRGPDEVDAVMMQVRREEFLYQDNPVVRSEGAVGLTTPDAALLHFLALPLFRARWGAVWPCTSLVDEEDEETERVFARAMEALEHKAREVQARLAAGGAAQPLVLEGRAGSYHRASLLADRPLEAEVFDRCEQQLAPLGFRHVGDLVCTKFADVVVSGWARDDGDAWAVLLSGLLESTFELVTEWEGGTWLTTTLRSATDDPERRLYRTGCPELNLIQLAELHRRHEGRKSALIASEGPARSARPDLRALAESIDRCLVRQLGLEAAATS